MMYKLVMLFFCTLLSFSGPAMPWQLGPPALGARSLHRRKVGIQNELHVLGDGDLKGGNSQLQMAALGFMAGPLRYIPDASCKLQGNLNSETRTVYLKNSNWKGRGLIYDSLKVSGPCEEHAHVSHESGPAASKTLYPKPQSSWNT